MFGQKKKNTFRPMLESLDGRELMSVSTITNVIPNSTAIIAPAKWDEAADIRRAIAADKDNTVSEANRYAQQNINLSTNNPVIKQGMISFETMPRKDRPSWGEYCGLNHRDVDLYKFTVNAGDRVSFAFNTWEQKMPWTEYKNGKPNTVTKTFSLGLNAQIFDPNKNAGNDFNLEGRISVSHNDNTKTTVLEHTFHKAGTYYLGVSSYWHKDYDIFSGKEGGRNNLSSPIGPYKITASVKKDLVAKPDLITTAFNYQVPDIRDAALRQNSPLAYNQPYTITATISNQGQATSAPTTLGIYLSLDGVINQVTDFRIGTAPVPSLAPGAQTTVSVKMAAPDSWPATLPKWQGVVTLGLVVDPNHYLPDADFSNNQNRGDGIDVRQVSLYDRVPPITYPVTGATQVQAFGWLLSNGFKPVPPFTGSGWSKSLSTDLNFESPFDGVVRSGLAYRQNAFVLYDVGANSYTILLQGNDQFGEPNPETAAFYGWGWFNYVVDWHARY